MHMNILLSFHVSLYVYLYASRVHMNILLSFHVSFHVSSYVYLYASRMHMNTFLHLMGADLVSVNAVSHEPLLLLRPSVKKKIDLVSVNAVSHELLFRPSVNGAPTH